MRLKKGLVQVYTGCGKGKTTASLGLALRASGAGLKVYIMQFIKGREYSELKAIKGLKNITVDQCGRGCFIRKKPSNLDIKKAEQGFLKTKRNILSGKYDVVILDEINITLHLSLLKTEEVVSLIKVKPKHVELVLTGRYCPKAILKKADLITKMHDVRHPYEKGIKARLGIES